MSLLETIHELSPWWVIVPAALFVFAFLFEDYWGPEFKKGDQELTQEQAKIDAQKALRETLARESIKRANPDK